MQYHLVTLQKGKIKFVNNNSRNLLSSLDDGYYIVCFLKANDSDTRGNQNRYFFILGEWSLSTGWTKEDLHELVKDELFKELFEESLSTTDLSNEQWTILFLQLENFLIKKFENL